MQSKKAKMKLISANTQKFFKKCTRSTLKIRQLGDVDWLCCDTLIFHWPGDYILNNFDGVFTKWVPVNFRGVFRAEPDI